MEIVHIVRQYRPSVGGLEDAVSNLCASLAQKENTSVRVITLDRWFVQPDQPLPSHEIIDGIPITRLPYKGSSRYPLAPSVLKEVRSADIIHVHAIDFFFDFMALTAPLHGKPLVASTHGGFFHTSFASRLKQLWFLTITRLSSQAYKTICASSEADAAMFRRIAGNRVVTIENGVNVTKWQGRSASKPRRHMIFIGRWATNKRLPLLIDFVAALNRTGTIWNLTVAGLPNDETESSLHLYSKTAGVRDRVQLYPAPNEKTIGDLIEKCSYIASASAYEGFGISIVEGLSAGLIPLTTTIPPFAKILHNLGLGVAIEPDNIDHSAREAEVFHKRLEMEHADLKNRCSIFAESYDWDRTAERFMKVYKKILMTNS